MLLADHPTREYQFVRELLLRNGGSMSPLGRDVIFSQDAALTLNDPPDTKFADRGGRMKVFPVQLEQDKEYRIQLTSEGFHADLRLLGPTGQIVAEDFNNGGAFRARIDCKARVGGQYQIVATAVDGKLGGFHLNVIGDKEAAAFAKVNIFLQSVLDQKMDWVLGGEHMLTKFPSLDGSDQEPGLRDFDVIVAIDPDWSALPADRLRDVQEWVALHGGGLIVVAGRCNASRLSWSGPAELRPIRAMLPVRLQDSFLEDGLLDNLPSPFSLRILEPASNILMLDPRDNTARAAWDRFFWAPRAAGKCETGPGLLLLPAGGIH